MRPWIQNVVRAGAALVLVGLMASCGDDGGTDVVDPGAIEVTVMADGSPLSGVTVDLYEPGGSAALSSRTTDQFGEVTFGGLDAGTYDVEITVPNGYTLTGDVRQAVTVSEGGTGMASYSLAATTSGPTEEVTLTNYAFTPGDLTIEPGTTVRWVNNTSMFHTITPDGHSEWAEGSVSSMGETFSHTFNDEGTFPYICVPHEGLGMTGTVTVAAPQP